jgi:RNA polymerase sigma factor (sigma-70 family)
MIKVLLAGDERIVLQGVKQILDDSPDIVAVLEAHTAEDMLEKIHVHALVDLVVWAPSSSTDAMTEVVSSIHAIRPRLPVVWLGENPNRSIADPSLPLASDVATREYICLARNSSPDELVSVIRMAMRQAADPVFGKARIEKPESTAREAGQTSQERRQGMRRTIEKQSMNPALTPRQKQVLRLIAHGYANKEIAQELGISVRTVEVHRFYLMRRLKAHNVAQLFHQAIRGRFIPKNFATSGRF